MLDDTVILVDSSEPSYVQYGAKDLANYLGEISGKPVVVSASLNAGKSAKSIIALGEKAALAMGADLDAAKELGDDGSEIRVIRQSWNTHRHRRRTQSSRHEYRHRNADADGTRRREIGLS